MEKIRISRRRLVGVLNREQSVLEENSELSGAPQQVSTPNKFKQDIYLAGHGSIKERVDKYLALSGIE